MHLIHQHCQLSSDSQPLAACEALLEAFPPASPLLVSAEPIPPSDLLKGHVTFFDH